ncbi:hypothetical protein LTR85_007307 [Meristemomyces frigidus]|nr:hypothetical protein LTR85_007307 [Meristemomyces frigidus]
MAVMAGRRIHYVHAMHAQYGPYVRLAPNEIGVNDARGFKQIHAISSGFTKTQWYQDLVFMARPGIFAMIDSKAHAARRKLFARPFSKTHLREHWEDTVRAKVELAVSGMQDEARSTGTVDILKRWIFMASDVSSTLMFGDCFHTLEKGEAHDCIRILQKALMGGGIGAEMPIVREIGRRLPMRASEIFGANKFLEDYGQAAVDNMKSQQGGKNIFANVMAEAERGEPMDDLDVKLEATGLIVAGTDTTAISLTYLVWAVLSRPTLQVELEKEIATLPGGYRDADLEHLPLLQAVVSEAYVERSSSSLRGS